jgi:hypothetical protein
VVILRAQHLAVALAICRTLASRPLLGNDERLMVSLGRNKRAGRLLEELAARLDGASNSRG